MSTKFKFSFPPKKLNKTSPISEFLESGEVDEKYYYRQDKYNYKIYKIYFKKDTFYQWEEYM